MQNWEYLTIPISYDGKKLKDWVLAYTDQPPLIGLQTILQTHGARGWELVSLNLEHQEAFPGFGVWHIGPAIYRATFKRTVET